MPNFVQCPQGQWLNLDHVHEFFVRKVSDKEAEIVADLPHERITVCSGFESELEAQEGMNEWLDEVFTDEEEEDEEEEDDD